jgi:hypothetical protein
LTPAKTQKADTLFRPLAEIDEAEAQSFEPFNLTPVPNQMPDLESKLRALLDEAKAAGAFASVGSVPVEDGIKKEFYFTLRVPAPQPTTTNGIR